MTSGPCARCMKKLDMRKGDTVWFCMQCPDVMGDISQGHTGYTYWLCPSCYEKHGETDHDFNFSNELAEKIYGVAMDFPVQHHLGSHKFMSMSQNDDLEKREGYKAFLEMGVPPKDLQIIDGAFEMLKDKEKKEVSVELMTEHLAASEYPLTEHPGGVAGAMACCLEVESITGIWVGRTDFIKMFIRMTVDNLIDRDVLFRQFQHFLEKQPKRVITLDANLDSPESGTLICRGLDGSEVASLSIEKSTTLREIEKQLLSITEVAGHQLKLITGDGAPLDGRIRGGHRIIDLFTGKLNDAVADSLPDAPLDRTESGETEICVKDEECGETVNQLIRLFESYDANCDRVLDIAELKGVLLNLSPPPDKPVPTDLEIDVIIKGFLEEADTNHDGRVDLSEFVRWLWRKPPSQRLLGDRVQFPPRTEEAPVLMRTRT